jgi:hypothetical protein
MRRAPMLTSISAASAIITKMEQITALMPAAAPAGRAPRNYVFQRELTVG